MDSFFGFVTPSSPPPAVVVEEKKQEEDDELTQISAAIAATKVAATSRMYATRPPIVEEAAVPPEELEEEGLEALWVEAEDDEDDDNDDDIDDEATATDQAVHTSPSPSPVAPSSVQKSRRGAFRFLLKRPSLGKSKANHNKTVRIPPSTSPPRRRPASTSASRSIHRKPKPTSTTSTKATVRLLEVGGGTVPSLSPAPSSSSTDPSSSSDNHSQSSTKPTTEPNKDSTNKQAEPVSSPPAAAPASAAAATTTTTTNPSPKPGSSSSKCSSSPKTSTAANQSSPPKEEGHPTKTTATKTTTTPSPRSTALGDEVSTLGFEEQAEEEAAELGVEVTASGTDPSSLSSPSAFSMSSLNEILDGPLSPKQLQLQAQPPTADTHNDNKKQSPQQIHATKSKDSTVTGPVVASVAAAAAVTATAPTASQGPTSTTPPLASPPAPATTNNQNNNKKPTTHRTSLLGRLSSPLRAGRTRSMPHPKRTSKQQQQQQEEEAVVATTISPSAHSFDEGMAALGASPHDDTKECTASLFRRKNNTNKTKQDANDRVVATVVEEPTTTRHLSSVDAEAYPEDEAALEANFATNQLIQAALSQDDTESLASLDGVKKFQVFVPPPSTKQQANNKNNQKSSPLVEATTTTSAPEVPTTFVPAPKGVQPALLIQKSWDSLVEEQVADERDATAMITHVQAMELQDSDEDEDDDDEDDKYSIQPKSFSQDEASFQKPKETTRSTLVAPTIVESPVIPQAVVLDNDNDDDDDQVSTDKYRVHSSEQAATLPVTTKTTTTDVVDTKKEAVNKETLATVQVDPDAALEPAIETKHKEGNTATATKTVGGLFASFGRGKKKREPPGKKEHAVEIQIQGQTASREQEAATQEVTPPSQNVVETPEVTLPSQTILQTRETAHPNQEANPTPEAVLPSQKVLKTREVAQQQLAAETEPTPPRVKRTSMAIPIPMTLPKSQVPPQAPQGGESEPVVGEGAVEMPYTFKRTSSSKVSLSTAPRPPMSQEKSKSPKLDVVVVNSLTDRSPSPRRKGFFGQGRQQGTPTRQGSLRSLTKESPKKSPSASNKAPPPKIPMKRTSSFRSLSGTSSAKKNTEKTEKPKVEKKSTPTVPTKRNVADKNQDSIKSNEDKSKKVSTSNESASGKNGSGFFGKRNKSIPESKKTTTEPKRTTTPPKSTPEPKKRMAPPPKRVPSTPTRTQRASSPLKTKQQKSNASPTKATKQPSPSTKKSVVPTPKQDKETLKPTPPQKQSPSMNVSIPSAFTVDNMPTAPTSTLSSTSSSLYDDEDPLIQQIRSQQFHSQNESRREGLDPVPTGHGRGLLEP